MKLLPSSQSHSKRLISRPLAFAAGCLLGLGHVMAANEDPANVLDSIQREIQTVFTKCKSAVVRIEAVDNHGPLSGSGFFIDPNGMLYTSYTVGGESRDIQVSFGGERYPARRLVSDLRSGIAILKIDAETPFLPFGDSQSLPVATPLIAVGYPMDLPLTPAFGTLGGFDLKYQGRYFATTHLRANISVQRGEGGAPLLNCKGDVVGILISRVDNGTASFALPIEAAEKIRKDFIRFREVRPGWLGLHVKSLEQPVSGSTALVEEVIPDAPAEKAGVKAGDVLVQVGKRPIASPEDVLNASFFLTAEDETVLRVSRDGSERDLTVTPMEHPEPNHTRLAPLGDNSTLPPQGLKVGGQ